MNYGERISHLRKELKLTQQDLANKLYVTDKTISSWESNRTEPNLEMIIKLSEILQCNVSYLLYGDNSKDNIEMEIKIKLSEEEYNLLNKRLKLRGKLLLETNQQDIYYISDNTNSNVYRSLRIRTTGNKKILTYKNTNNKMYCEEYEVEIENTNNLEKIFEAIGLNKIIEINKHRFIYSYQDKYEVSIDYIKELGYFIEIEVKDNINNYLEEYDNLLKISKELGLNLNNIIHKRYPELLEEKNNE